MSKEQLKSLPYRKQLEPIAQQAHVFSAEVTAVFASAWGTKSPQPTAPTTAKPLHFPRREATEDLVEDVDDVLAEITEERLRAAGLPSKRFTTPGVAIPKAAVVIPEAAAFLGTFGTNATLKDFIEDPHTQEFIGKIGNDPSAQAVYQQAARNPKMMAAMKDMAMQELHNPTELGRRYTKYMNDPELGPILKVMMNSTPDLP